MALDPILLSLTGASRVEGGYGTKGVQRGQFAEPTGVGIFEGVPEEKPPVIEGGTHITGLGLAGEKFDSFKYLGY